jgi:transcriptional regulator with XRE-family HTH domain
MKFSGDKLRTERIRGGHKTPLHLCLTIRDTHGIWITPQSLSNWENDKNVPSAASLALIAKALELPMERFFICE